MIKKVIIILCVLLVVVSVIFLMVCTPPSGDDSIKLLTTIPEMNVSTSTTMTTTTTVTTTVTTTTTTCGVSGTHIIISAFSPGGISSTDEFCELYNPTNATVDISNWKIRRKTSAQACDTTASTAICTITSGTYIPPKKYFSIASTSFNANHWGGTDTVDLPSTDFSLGGATGCLYITTGSTCCTGTIDIVAYSTGATVACSETAPCAWSDAGNALVRTTLCTDSDNNSTEFTEVPASSAIIHNSTN